MPTRYAFLLMLAAGAAAQDLPQAAGAASDSEYLVTMAPRGLVARTTERDGVSQTDWLPPGEPIERAARVVTIERIAGGAGADGPLHLVEGLALCLRPCPDQRVSPVDRTAFQGHPAARVTIDMPATAISGRPSRFYALAVSGDHDLHVVIVVIRGERAGANVAFAQGVLRSVTLCTPATRAAACVSR
jgi:hypothetical protein